MLLVSFPEAVSIILAGTLGAEDDMERQGYLFRQVISIFVAVGGVPIIAVCDRA